MSSDQVKDLYERMIAYQSGGARKSRSRSKSKGKSKGGCANCCCGGAVVAGGQYRSCSRYEMVPSAAYGHPVERCAEYKKKGRKLTKKQIEQLAGALAGALPGSRCEEYKVVPSVYGPVERCARFGGELMDAKETDRDRAELISRIYGGADDKKGLLAELLKGLNANIAVD